jgi:sugar phosphate isomerase/epimerase
MRLGINLSFAVKRWPEPEVWAAFVREKLELELVQFTFDLLDPLFPEPMATSMARKVRKAADEWGIQIHSTFTGLAAYSFNSLLSPDPDGRQVALQWWKRAIDLTAVMGCPAIGGAIGAVSVESARDSSKAAWLYDQLLDALQELGHSAAVAGIHTLLVEATPVRREIPYTVEQAERLMRDLDGRSEVPIRLLIDVGHALYKPLYGSDVGLPSWLSPLSRYVDAFHLQNSDFQSDPHWGWPAPGGLFDVEEFARQLREAGLESAPCFLEMIYPFEAEDGEVMANVTSSAAHCRRFLG